ncbi:universal stress protein PHOS34 [Cinnamomum micranthum f. kanehirae]|uniref:Universal stress protein PHOS34 n=1 Tax=Cinnamomum micranthum f. kanehirae TaxID=337451 RepID=A0A3S3PAJ3_9MAGN|nr:universal stress protein PHOS34 [Cinnamomum micranthum f. kanehirae]
MIQDAIDRQKKKKIIFHTEGTKLIRSRIKFRENRAEGHYGAGDMHTMVEANLRKSAAAIMDRAKDLCQKRSISDYVVEVGEGDARNVLCQAVEKHVQTFWSWAAKAMVNFKGLFWGV